MLTYLINITEYFLAVSIVLGVVLGFADSYCKDRGKMICRAGMLIGLVAAAIRAYITNTNRLVGGWRVGAYGYGISIVTFLLMMIGLLVFGRKYLKEDLDSRTSSGAEIASCLLIALNMVAVLYNSLPNVLVAPFQFNIGDSGYLSTDFLFRLGGYLLALIICFVSAICAYRIICVSVKKGFRKAPVFVLVAVNLLYALFEFAGLMLVLTPRKIIDSIMMFNFGAWSNNHYSWYTYAEFILLLSLAIVLWIRSHTMKEPYATKAEHRKQRAVWRSLKRHTATMCVCFILGILCATWFVKLNTVVIQEAPVEDPVIEKDANGEDSQVNVPLTMVEDGHLHRFGYTTSDGKNVRFIVILKQENTTNYGVGLDACEICGEAGYYENNEGQVVCKKCNVVMNTTTIGMKGGCNPIIIDYDIDESKITVPVSELVKNEDRFKE